MTESKERTKRKIEVITSSKVGEASKNQVAGTTAATQKKVKMQSKVTNVTKLPLDTFQDGAY